MVVTNLIVISSSLNCVANGEVISSNKIITEFLFLPFCKKKLLNSFGKKCIIGKIRKIEVYAKLLSSSKLIVIYHFFVFRFA